MPDRLLASILVLMVFAAFNTGVPSLSHNNYFKNTDSIPVAVPNDSDTIFFTKLDKDPSVNLEAWKNHLEKKLLKPLNKAARKGMKAGLYTIHIRFIVEKDGSIVTAEVLNDPGFGMGEAAIDIIRSGPRWTPGAIKGKPVRSYHTQPISFRIE